MRCIILAPRGTHLPFKTAKRHVEIIHLAQFLGVGRIALHPREVAHLRGEASKRTGRQAAVMLLARLPFDILTLVFGRNSDNNATERLIEWYLTGKP